MVEPNNGGIRSRPAYGESVKILGPVDPVTFMVGGKAGYGVKKAGNVAAHIFKSMGRYTFEMDDYQSLIRGGHNFSAVTADVVPVYSHYPVADAVVCLDALSFKIHIGSLKYSRNKPAVGFYNADKLDWRKFDKAVEDFSNRHRNEPDMTEIIGNGWIGIPFSKMVRDSGGSEILLGVGAVAALTFVLGIGFDGLRNIIKTEYTRNSENNIKYAGLVYEFLESLGDDIPRITPKKGKGAEGHPGPILYGNEAIALGASAAGLDIYYAYPMTPASSILHFLAKKGPQLGVTVIHPENEIAVINMAIGSAIAGARTAVGSSGGGFALMQEAFSLAGMAEVPLLCIVSSRPGPSTGVPTYTEQADLMMVINQGHGEFSRIVASPSTVGEAFRLAAELLYLAWKFQTPAVLLTEKHLSESASNCDVMPEDVRRVSLSDVITEESFRKGPDGRSYFPRYRDTESGISPFLPLSIAKIPIKWSGYEHDEIGISTEDPAEIVKMKNKRLRKFRTIRNYLYGIGNRNGGGIVTRRKWIYRPVNRNRAGKENGPPLTVITYGSTAMSVIEAAKYAGIDCIVYQQVYLEPLPIKRPAETEGFDVAVEMSSTGMFANLIREKTGSEIRNVIKKYDGRPFDIAELGKKLEEIYLEKDRRNVP